MPISTRTISVSTISKTVFQFENIKCAPQTSLSEVDRTIPGVRRHQCPPVTYRASSPLSQLANFDVSVSISIFHFFIVMGTLNMRSTLFKFQVPSTVSH